jgi:hypothetical protein
MKEEQSFSQDEVLAHIGVLLLNVQSFEWLLLQALKLVYDEQADLTAQKIFAQDKRTLGVLIKDLRSKALISGDVEALLQKVLEDRNLFAHNLLHQDWFDLSTHEERERALDFLMPFTQNLNLAIQLFVAVHIKHGDEIGFDSPDVRKIRKDDLWRVADFYPHADKIQKKGYRVPGS